MKVLKSIAKFFIVLVEVTQEYRKSKYSKVQ
jgi:hypothetical protein